MAEVSRRVLLSLVTAPLLAGCTRQPVTTDGARLQTAQDAPAFDTMEVARTANPDGKRVLLSVRLDLAARTIVMATGEFQVSNTSDFNIYVGSQLLLGSSPEATRGTGLSQPGGENVTPAMHHAQQTRSANRQIGVADLARPHLNLVVWAASSRATPGMTLGFDRGYSQLSAVLL